VIVVHTVEDGLHQFPTGINFMTEEMFNNLCIHDRRGTLLACFSQDKWIGVKVTEDDDGED
jgi:hypothetical protein